MLFFPWTPVTFTSLLYFFPYFFLFLLIFFYIYLIYNEFLTVMRFEQPCVIVMILQGEFIML